MSTVKEGTKARVVDYDIGFHEFEVGSVVTATGELYYQQSLWPDCQEFVDEFGDTQWLQPEHYTVLENSYIKDISEEIMQSRVENTIDTIPKKKVVYAVVDANGDVIYTTSDRDYSREVKAGFGGKKSGIKIFQYAATKEIR